MSTLAGFRELSFMDQIALLGEVERAAAPSSVEGLQQLFLEPVGDAAVDTMVRNALRSLLLAHPHALLQALEHPDPRLAGFCMGLAGDRGLAEAVPVLVQVAHQREAEPELLHEALLALGRIGDPAALELYRRHLHHEDDFISSLCIEHLGTLKDEQALPELQDMVTANEAPDRYEQCEVATWKAIEALADIGSDAALAFLASKLHHENPTARRIVHRCLIEAGQAATSHVADVLRTSDSGDQRIMAANVLGFSGVKQGADALINCLDDGLLTEPNERFAAYEALGRVSGMKSLVFLEDALWHEEDHLLLLAVTKSLDAHAQSGLGQGLVKKIAGKAQEDFEKVRHILEAMVGAGAWNLLAPLAAAEQTGDTVLQMAAVQEPAQIKDFAATLETLGLADAAQQLRNLAGESDAQSSGPRLLAVDDSGAMRNFYNQAGAELGYQVTTAADGQQALDIIESGEEFDVLVVDMNMPVMDGIELTTRLRGMPEWQAVPIVMASTESARSQAQLAKKAGVSTFIVKPFTKEVFKNKIAKLLS